VPGELPRSQPLCGNYRGVSDDPSEPIRDGGRNDEQLLLRMAAERVVRSRIAVGLKRSSCDISPFGIKARCQVARIGTNGPDEWFVF